MATMGLLNPAKTTTYCQQWRQLAKYSNDTKVNSVVSNNNATRMNIHLPAFLYTRTDRSTADQ